MRNKALVVLIIVAALFPFVSTMIELIKDPMALLALAAMSVVAIAVSVAAFFYRPKPTADTDTPVQLVPTVPQSAARPNSVGNSAAKPNAKTNQGNSKRQRTR